MSIIPTTIDNNKINTIISVNNIINDFNNDIMVADDIVYPTFEVLKDNHVKAIELSIAVYKYALRNTKISILYALFPKMNDVINSITDIAILERYSNLGASLIKYIPFNLTKKDHTYIQNSLQSLQISILNKKASLVPTDRFDSLSDADMRLSAMLDTLTGVLEEGYKEFLVQESVKDVVRKTGDAIGKKIVSFTLKDREMSKRINDKFNRVLSDYQNDKKDASYETIVKQSVDLSKMIKQIISSSIVALLIPGGLPIKLIGGAITLLIQFSNNKKTDNKYRGVVLNDLKFELRIIQEKIKDAEQKGDSKAKYKLLRLENEVSRAIDKITYGLSAKQS